MDIVFISLILIIYSTHIISIGCELKSVNIVMRHGIRAPLGTYPSDPQITDPSRWPNGLTQLTDSGIKQAVNVGKYIRKKYKKFYGKNSKNAILRSVNVDRCLDTISLVSRQLWPPNGKSDWIQPRIFGAPMPLDGITSPNYCPNGSNQTENNLNNPEFFAFITKYQWLFDYVSNNTGLPATISNTLTVFDVIKSAKASGYELPDWVTNDYYNQMDFISYKTFDFLISGDLTLKLMSGLLLEELSTRMGQVLNSSLESDRWYKNFFMYSTHDLEIFGIIKALGIEQSKSTPFLATIIFELHEINGNKIVKTFYINETESLPIGGFQVKPDFCSDFDCPYDTFISSITKFFPDWKTDCGIPDNFDPYPVLEKYLTVTDESDVDFDGKSLNYIFKI